MSISRIGLFVVCVLSVVALPLHAQQELIAQDELAEIVAKKLHGDRTGACFAVAVVQAESVVTLIDCADPKKKRAITVDSAFEIGSVSKTFNATLLAWLIEQGKLNIDDPLQQHLPEGIVAPTFEEQAITLRHLLTHTSGLPSIPAAWKLTNPADPYSTVTEDDLLGALATVRLRRAPGTQFEYSNFAAMLLSHVVARTAGEDYEVLLNQHIFSPLKMRNSYTRTKPEGTHAVTGRLPTGKDTPAWTFPMNTEGVGGIRSSLSDMVRYVQGGMGIGDAGTVSLMQQTHEPMGEVGRPMAMAWMVSKMSGERFMAHEGGTGGFSSFVAFSPTSKKGVVILSDTSLTALGGLGNLGLHLINPRWPLGGPRKVAKPDPAVLERMAGDYVLDGGLQMKLSVRKGVLYLQAAGQPEFEMAYDSAGDFYPLAFDALLKPNAQEKGFMWMQGGGAMTARPSNLAPALNLSAEQLASYEGVFELQPGFELKLFAQEGVLMAQATGQGAIALRISEKDVATADQFGIRIEFRRDEAGALKAIQFSQSGRVIDADKKS